jgi:hypothetical protein
MQFHAVTNGHNQMHAAISAFVETAREYGQALPELAATDNPSLDQNRLYEMIPMLQKTQDKLDHLTGIAPAERDHDTTNETEMLGTEGAVMTNESETTGTDASTSTGKPAWFASTVSDEKQIRVASAVEDIGWMVLAVREILSAQPAGSCIAALDAKWDTKKNSSGRVVQSFKTALIQLGYRDSEN